MAFPRLSALAGHLPAVLAASTALLLAPSSQAQPDRPDTSAETSDNTSTHRVSADTPGATRIGPRQPRSPACFACPFNVDFLE